MYVRVYIYVYIDFRNLLPYRCAPENMSAERINFHEIRHILWIIHHKIIQQEEIQSQKEEEAGRKKERKCLSVCVYACVLRLRLLHLRIK